MDIKRGPLFIVLGALLVAGAWWYVSVRDEQTVTNTWQPPPANEVPHVDGPPGPPPGVVVDQGASIGDENLVQFRCAEGRTITAVFARDIVGLTLSDGRRVELRQAASDDGVRYINNTARIEFLGGDAGASLVEDGRTSYADCTIAQ